MDRGLELGRQPGRGAGTSDDAMAVFDKSMVPSFGVLPGSPPNPPVVTGVSSQHASAPNTHEHRPLGSFSLPILPAARNSTSSLMDAVIGSPARTVAGSPLTGDNTPGVRSETDTSPGSRQTPSSMSNGETDSWDVLSDASLRLNEGESEEVVQELQKKVDKRRSQLPQLESQLAALEAKIKAAEERLAQAEKVQVGDEEGAQRA